MGRLAFLDFWSGQFDKCTVLFCLSRVFLSFFCLWGFHSLHNWTRILFQVPKLGSDNLFVNSLYVHQIVYAIISVIFSFSFSFFCSFKLEYQVYMLKIVFVPYLNTFTVHQNYCTILMFKTVRTWNPVSGNYVKSFITGYSHNISLGKLYMCLP